MKKLSIVFFAVILLIVSCKKTEDSTNTSFTMTYDGETYTEVEEASLNVTFGSIAVAGKSPIEFSLTVIGIGADGSTSLLCEEGCEGNSVILDFGAVEGKEAFVATSGTIKRSGKKIVVDVSGVTTSLDNKSLTATIVVDKII